ncbi:YrzE family protein [Lysinibacillus sp. CTST325]
MKIIKLTIFYLFIFILTLLLSLAGVRLSITIGIIALIVIVMIYRHIHILFRTNNMTMVDKLVKNRKNDPFFAYLYAVAYGTSEDQLHSLETAIVKYKQPAMKYNCKFIKAIMEENLEEAKDAANKINKEPLTSYAKCYIAAFEGRTTDMRSDQLTQPWMQPAIEAVYAYKIKNETALHHHAQESIEMARGVQKYVLIHTFENMKTDL